MKRILPIFLVVCTLLILSSCVEEDFENSEYSGDTYLNESVQVVDAPDRPQYLKTISASKNLTMAIDVFGNVKTTERFLKEQNEEIDTWKNIIEVSAGGFHSAALKKDGTVKTINIGDMEKIKISCWSDIISVDVGLCHTVGLTKKGNVLAVADSDPEYARFDYGQSNVDSWENIIAISAGRFHTVGLKTDGTVVAVGRNDDGQCNVEGWQDIISISAGEFHTVGLKSDGTVIAVGWNNTNQCDVAEWKDITAISASLHHTVGLKSDGTVITTGCIDSKMDFYEACQVGEWTDIVAISAGETHTAALKSDGTAISTIKEKDFGGGEYIDDWKRIKLPSKRNERLPTGTEDLPNLNKLPFGETFRASETTDWKFMPDKVEIINKINNKVEYCEWEFVSDGYFWAGDKRSYYFMYGDYLVSMDKAMYWESLEGDSKTGYSHTIDSENFKLILKKDGTYISNRNITGTYEMINERIMKISYKISNKDVEKYYLVDHSNYMHDAYLKINKTN